MTHSHTLLNMNMVLRIVVCLCAVTLSLGRPQAPSSQYGVPGAGGDGGGGYGDGKPAGGGGGDDLAEEANYNFAYEVKDAESGNDFGHMESRMGEVAQGSYHVLLPDGRMQKVDYTADEGGYKPVISYTGEAKYGPGVGGGKAGGGGGGGGAGGTGGAGGGYFYRR